MFQVFIVNYKTQDRLQVKSISATNKTIAARAERLSSMLPAPLVLQVWQGDRMVSEHAGIYENWTK